MADLTLSTAEWIRVFHGDEDLRFCVEGCAYGFDWSAVVPTSGFEVPNFVPDEHKEKAAAEIAGEVAAGRVVPVPRSAVHGVSAIGVVDKEKSGMVKVRLIHDLSRPEGDSLNDHTEIFERRFASVNQAGSLLRPKAFMAKMDLSKAYGSVPVEPWHWSTPCSGGG